ncbi:hypothetical protein Tco_1377982 [Tanacetum coccineum]
MTETIEKYMSKTRTDYGLGVARPKIDNKDQFELKGQFLKELRENTFSGSDNEDVNEHIKKVLKIVDLFHVPNITVDQLMFRVFPISLTRAANCPPGRTAKKMEEINNFQQESDETLFQAWEHFKELLMKCPQHYLTEMQEVILFYNGLDIPTRQILDSRGAIPTKTAEDAKKAIQEMAEYSQKWHNGTSRGRSTETSDGLAAIQAQLNNLGREIKKVNEKVYAAQVGCEQCKGPHYTKDCLQKEEGKTLEEAYYMQFGGPFQGGGYRATAPGDLAKRHEENSNLIKEIQATTDAAIRNQGASIKTLEIQIGKMSKVLQERGFGSLPSSTETNLRDQVKSISTTIEVDSHSIRRIGSSQYAVSTGQNRASVSVMPLSTYLNLGLDELAHTRLTVDLANKIVKYPKGIAENVLVGIGDNLMPTIEECEVIEEFRTAEEELDIRIDDYPSYCDDDKKIHIDCAHNLKFSCMIGFEFTHVNFYPLLYVNVMSRKFHNLIMKNKMVYKGDNVEGALMNVPIFVGTFFVMTDFAVLKDMDAYCDEGMGDVIVGEPFLREVGIKAKHFKGTITLYNGDNEKISEKDVKNGTSHAYQKLKGFYKEVLNLGPNYIRNAKMEEWLTRGNISVHEME